MQIPKKCWSSVCNMFDSNQNGKENNGFEVLIDASLMHVFVLWNFCGNVIYLSFFFFFSWQFQRSPWSGDQHASPSPKSIRSPSVRVQHRTRCSWRGLPGAPDDQRRCMTYFLIFLNCCNTLPSLLVAKQICDSDRRNGSIIFHGTCEHL